MQGDIQSCCCGLEDGGPVRGEISGGQTDRGHESLALTWSPSSLLPLCSVSWPACHFLWNMPVCVCLCLLGTHMCLCTCVLCPLCLSESLYLCGTYMYVCKYMCLCMSAYVCLYVPMLCTYVCVLVCLCAFDGVCLCLCMLI